MSIIKKTIIIFLVIIFCISIIVYFIIIPTIKDINKISDSIVKEKEDLEIKYQKGQLLKKISKDFDSIRPQKDKLFTIFLTKGNELEFVTTLEEISKIYNVSQNISINQTAIKKNGEIYTLPIIATADGDYINILKYLYDIEKLNYYFNIEEINIKQVNQETGTVQATFNGFIFSKERDDENKELKEE